MYNDVRQAIVCELDHLLTEGDKVVVRGSTTHEIMHHCMTIDKPQHRFSFLLHRNGNPFAQLAETLWVLAGRDDLDWLERYIPQCKKWSDDGKTWRAAYGPRLRRWETIDMDRWEDGSGDSHLDHNLRSTDQIAEVVMKLKADPFTRQAVISLWNPAQDWVDGSKDYPCNNWLHFMIRDGKLHLNVAVRSNDIMYGFSHVDFFCWSALQEMIAYWVGAEIGRMTWNASSFHLYDSHIAKAQKIVDGNIIYISPYNVVKPLVFKADFDTFDAMLADIFTYEQTNRKGQYDTLISAITACPFLRWSQYMLMMYNLYLNNKDEQDMYKRVIWVKKLAGYISDMPHLVDFKIAAIEYFARHVPGIVGELTVSAEEYKVLRTVSLNIC